MLRGDAGRADRASSGVVITGPHRSLLPAGLLAAAVTLIGCQSAEEPTPTAAPTPTVEPSVAASESAAPSVQPGSEGEEISAFDLEVGDCFSVERNELTSVIVVECVRSHEYEVFGVFDHPAAPGEPFPGDAVIVEYADTACQPFFEEYVGHDYQTSIWYITSLTPSDGTWAGGDREITCTLNRQDDNDNEEPIAVTGSAEGAAE
jgi:hypothetical protein